MDISLDNYSPNIVNNSIFINSSISNPINYLRDDKASRVKIFSLLLDTLGALRVTYDSNIATKVINKQLGVAKKLLYELKTVPILSYSNSKKQTQTHLPKQIV